MPTKYAEDIGKSAYGIFMGGLDGKYIGESVYVAGDCLTCAQIMMDIASEVTGNPPLSLSLSTEPLMPALNSPAPIRPDF